MGDKKNLPAPVQISVLTKATRAESDEQLLQSWLASLLSQHSRRNFETTARRFLAELPSGGLRTATVEDVRDALGIIIKDVSAAAGRQYSLRVKSLLSYGHDLGYLQFNAGTAIKVRSEARSRGAALAKRIISEVDVALLVRGARTKRDRIMLEVLYAGGLRVSELVNLTWSAVISREKGVQLNVLGKGGVERNVLLPEAVSRSLLSLRGDAGPDDPVFASRKGGGKLKERAVLGTVKRAARKAGIEAPVSPHWLRHAHASHAIDRGATLPEVQSTLGHGNIATTSGYLHARPETSSGLHLDPGVWLQR
jgi:integrase/recombinase XerD